MAAGVAGMRQTPYRTTSPSFNKEMEKVRQMSPKEREHWKKMYITRIENRMKQLEYQESTRYKIREYPINKLRGQVKPEIYDGGPVKSQFAHKPLPVSLQSIVTSEAQG